MALRQRSFGDLSREHRRSFPGGIAVIDHEVRLTWPQFDDRVNRLANSLIGAGVGQGDRLLWLAQTSFRVFELLAAASKLGAMLCPVNWRMSAEEMEFVLGDFDPKVVLWQREEIGAVIDTVKARAKVQRLWLQHDATGEGSYERFLAAQAARDPERIVDPDSALLVIYTSAFGGRPNGSMLSQRNLISMGLTSGAVCRSSDKSIFLNSGPLFHIGNFEFEAIPTYLYGGTNIFTRRVVAEELLETIHKERCTAAFLMPPTVMQMKAANKDRRFDLSCLRGGAMTPLWEGMTARDDSPWATAVGGFGQTEVSGLAVFNAFGGRGQGNAGRPSPFALLRILGRDGTEVADGEAGEICIGGDIAHLGYWNRPELNARRMQGGWWHTTDLGRRMPDGTLHFIGTMTQMIKSAAENIYPAEVEACIETHPAVKEAAIIGVPDPQWTQSVKAIVVLKPGQTLSADAVIDHCRAHIASYKKPKSVEFVDVLPRKEGQKDYASLDARFGGGGYPGGANVAG